MLPGRLARFLRRARALPWSTWGILARVLPAVLAARIALWVLPYPTVARLFEPPAGRPRKSPKVLRGTVRVADWVGRTFLGDMPCLAQALAARWLLGRAGFDDVELRIGARLENGKLAAHAWLERDGGVILGGSDSPATYAMFQSIAGERPVAPELSGSL